MVESAAGSTPLAYSSPEAVQTTGTVALLRAIPSSAHCRLTDSPASGAIIARLSALGRWRAARQENRTRPAAVRSCGADHRSPSAYHRPPAPAATPEQLPRTLH